MVLAICRRTFELGGDERGRTRAGIESVDLFVQSATDISSAGQRVTRQNGDSALSVYFESCLTAIGFSGNNPVDMPGASKPLF